MFRAGNPNFVELYKSKELDLRDMNKSINVIVDVDNNKNKINVPIENEVALIMEFTPYGNLKQFIEDHQNSPININGKNVNLIELASDFVTDISTCMKFIHFLKIIHLDLKPENILVFWNAKLGRFVFKVSDVGGSVRIQ